MKVLELNQMEQIEGGFFSKMLAKNLCIPLSGVGMMASLLGVALVTGPVGIIAGTTAIIGVSMSLLSIAACVSV